MGYDVLGSVRTGVLNVPLDGLSANTNKVWSYCGPAKITNFLSVVQSLNTVWQHIKNLNFVSVQYLDEMCCNSYHA